VAETMSAQSELWNSVGRCDVAKSTQRALCGSICSSVTSSVRSMNPYITRVRVRSPVRVCGAGTPGCVVENPCVRLKRLLVIGLDCATPELLFDRPEWKLPT